MEFSLSSLALDFLAGTAFAAELANRSTYPFFMTFLLYETGLLVGRGKKVKFRGIFRDKFAEKTADFAGIFAGIFEASFAENDW